MDLHDLRVQRRQPALHLLEAQALAGAADRDLLVQRVEDEFLRLRRLERDAPGGVEHQEPGVAGLDERLGGLLRSGDRVGDVGQRLREALLLLDAEVRIVGAPEQHDLAERTETVADHPVERVAEPQAAE